MTTYMLYKERVRRFCFNLMSEHMREEYSWARNSWEYENYERYIARSYGARPVEWDEETGNPSKEIGPQAAIPFWLYMLVTVIPDYIWYGWIAPAICDRFDHDWVDESYGGPDTGCMAGSCRRCGFSFHHTLY